MTSKKNSFPTPFSWAFLVVLFFCTVSGATWVPTQHIHLNFLISKTQAEKDKLVTWNRNLKIEEARLMSPERIRKLGETRLGLVMPKTENTFDLGGMTDEEGS